MSHKIGYIVGFTILKALPDYDAYLCKLIDSSFLALLPKKYSRKEYKIGDTDWACIFDIKGPRVTLSQKSPQYVRKILEYLLSPILEEMDLKLKHVAWARGFRYHKVAIETPNGAIADSKELYQALQPFLEKINLKEYFSEKVSFVKYSRDIKEYVINALCPPGDKNKIWKVIYHEEIGKVVILVENSVLGLFIGKGGENYITASKLGGCEVEIKGISSSDYEMFTK
jgi:transcription antitermination factor NusA-like protein